VLIIIPNLFRSAKSTNTRRFYHQGVIGIHFDTITACKFTLGVVRLLNPIAPDFSVAPPAIPRDWEKSGRSRKLKTVENQLHTVVDIF